MTLIAKINGRAQFCVPLGQSFIIIIVVVVAADDDDHDDDVVAVVVVNILICIGYTRYNTHSTQFCANEALVAILLKISIVDCLLLIMFIMSTIRISMTLFRKLVYTIDFSV